MEFRVIDNSTNEVISIEKIREIARENELHDMDLEGFAVTEDGIILLCDECGNFAYLSGDDYRIEVTSASEGELDEIVRHEIAVTDIDALAEIQELERGY